MIYRRYKTVNFRAEARERIALCDEIIHDYHSQGLRMSLRQLHYQFVSRNVIGM